MEWSRLASSPVPPHALVLALVLLCRCASLSTLSYSAQVRHRSGSISLLPCTAMLVAGLSRACRARVLHEYKMLPTYHRVEARRPSVPVMACRASSRGELLRRPFSRTPRTDRFSTAARLVAPVSVSSEKRRDKTTSRRCMAKVATRHAYLLHMSASDFASVGPAKRAFPSPRNPWGWFLPQHASHRALALALPRRITISALFYFLSPPLNHLTYSPFVPLSHAQHNSADRSDRGCIGATGPRLNPSLRQAFTTTVAPRCEWPARGIYPAHHTFVRRCISFSCAFAFALVVDAPPIPAMPLDVGPPTASRHLKKPLSRQPCRRVHGTTIYIAHGISRRYCTLHRTRRRPGGRR